MLDYFKQAIAKLQSENRYREFLDISRICGDFPHAINNKNGQKIGQYTIINGHDHERRMKLCMMNGPNRL